MINPNRIYEVKQTDFMNFGGVPGAGEYRGGRPTPEKGGDSGDKYKQTKGGSSAKADRGELRRPGPRYSERKESSESSQEDYRNPPRRTRDLHSNPHLKLSETDIDLAEETCDLLGEVIEGATSLADFDSGVTRRRHHHPHRKHPGIRQKV